MYLIVKGCHLCTFNVAAIFSGHPYIWRTTACRDTQNITSVQAIYQTASVICGD